MLAHWVAIALFHTAVERFALCVCGVCVHACVTVCAAFRSATMYLQKPLHIDIIIITATLYMLYILLVVCCVVQFFCYYCVCTYLHSPTNAKKVV